MPTLFTAPTRLTSILNLNIIPEGWARGGSTVNNFLQVPTAFFPTPPTPVLPKPQKPKVDRSYQSFGSRPQKVFVSSDILKSVLKLSYVNQEQYLIEFG